MYIVNFKLLYGILHVCTCSVLFDFYKFLDCQYTDYYV